MRFMPFAVLLALNIHLSPTLLPGELGTKRLTAVVHTVASRDYLHCMYIQVQKTFKNEQRNRDDTAQKIVNTSGVGESNNYYEDIYNIYTSLQQHSLTTPIDSTH